MIEKNNIRELKRFAVMMSCAFPVVFALLLPWLFEHAIPWWPFSISALLMVLYVAYPKGIYYPFRVWMVIATVLGWINTRLILGLVFFVLILPFGLVARLAGKLQYKHTSESANSNWVSREPSNDNQELERPF